MIVPHKINHITYVTLDIHGRRKRLWGYVIKDLHYDLMLGKGWAERNNVVYEAKSHTLYMNKGQQKLKMLEKGGMESNYVKNKTKYIREGKLISALAFSAFTKKAQNSSQNLTLASVSIADINKALQKLNNK